MAKKDLKTFYVLTPNQTKDHRIKLPGNQSQKGRREKTRRGGKYREKGVRVWRGDGKSGDWEGGGGVV